MSARKYAEREGLNTSTLYGWSSRLGRGEVAAPAHFIEVSPPVALPRPLVVRIGAVEIPDENGFDAQLLRAVVAALVSP